MNSELESHPMSVMLPCLYFDCLLRSVSKFLSIGCSKHCCSIQGPHILLKDTLWVLRHDEPLVHVSVDISLITKHILDHDTSLKS